MGTYMEVRAIEKCFDGKWRVVELPEDMWDWQWYYGFTVLANVRRDEGSPLKTILNDDRLGVPDFWPRSEVPVNDWWYGGNDRPTELVLDGLCDMNHNYTVRAWHRLSDLLAIDFEEVFDMSLCARDGGCFKGPEKLSDIAGGLHRSIKETESFFMNRRHPDNHLEHRNPDDLVLVFAFD